MTNIIELTSVNNDIVKAICALNDKKNRKATNKIILEGEKSVLGAIEAGYKIIDLFFENEKFNFEAKNKYKVNQKILEKLSSTKSPAPVVATILRPEFSLSEFKKYKKIVLLDSIKDAGNLGTIIRSALAFGLDGIILSGEYIDPFSPKVIRASAGNIFKIPILETQEPEKFKDSHKFLTTVVSGGKPLSSLDLKEKFILVMGSEATGISKKFEDLSDKFITLNIKNSVESLNLSVCASIFFWEINKLN